MSGQLKWGVVHTEKFWREHAREVEADDFFILKQVCLLKCAPGTLPSKNSCFHRGGGGGGGDDGAISLKRLTYLYLHTNDPECCYEASRSRGKESPLSVIQFWNHLQILVHERPGLLEYADGKVRLTPLGLASHVNPCGFVEAFAYCLFPGPSWLLGTK